MSRFARLLTNATAVLALVVVAGGHGTDTAVSAQCGPNPIVCENAQPGAPASEWDIVGAGDASIQGFATDISVNKGQTISFKVTTSASFFNIDIYRLGYYSGLGARRVASLQDVPGDTQPACLTDPGTGLVDCGNWTTSASWAVPPGAVSGIYIAKLTRIDSGGASHIVFVVRDDESQSDMLFQISDTTWQAYNRYGGNSLYVGAPAGRAYKVSYNRPFTTREYAPEDWLFNAEYPMVRWLEANGYHVSYSTGVDSDRRGAEIREHGIFLSVGHDEYWSGEQRAQVEAARAAGVNLAFFSGNEIFWKTRWEASIDGSATSHRTLVSYKETHANAKIDPATDPVTGQPIWTGTWRDPRFSPPADGGRPENALSGTIFTVNSGATTSIQVPESEGKFRFWRNTSVAALAPGQTAVVGDRTLGYEWDEDLDNGSRPPGLIRLSSTTVSGAPRLLDYGSTYGPGTATHAVTLYRHTSGALVFGAGTIQWPWGLDGEHDRGFSAPSLAMQQATVNLFADMGVAPATLQAGLVHDGPSLDAFAPTSTITSPASGASLAIGTLVTIAGTATDAGGGLVAGVELSVDGGATWRTAIGRQNWTFQWTPVAAGAFTIRSRAIDDSGNVEVPSSGTTVNVSATRTCPCSFWDNTTVPDRTENDVNAVEVGVRFRADADGFITALRFHKGATNTGTHVGHLWTAAGTLLASATFTNETASGWQEIALSSPVAVTGNTIYVASYHTTVGRYSVSSSYFASDYASPPLLAPATGGNGVYRYGASGSFPNQTFLAENYWVDVVFVEALGPDTTPPTVQTVSPPSGGTGASASTSVTATFSEAMNAATITAATFQLRNAAGVAVPATVSWTSATRTATLQPSSALAYSATYTATITGGSAGVHDTAGNALASTYSWAFTTTAEPSPLGCPCRLWSNSVVPDRTENDVNAVEVGVRFRADVDGFITGLRFHKGTTNTGTHVGHLWTAAGTLLASATFTNETASGWQEIALSSPVAVTGNTIYVASYHTTVGRYSVSSSYFASDYANPPLVAPASGGNAVYRYGPSGSFPNQTYLAENYWVDVVFVETLGPDTTPPTVQSVSPPSGGTGASVAASVTATFNEAMDPATITAATFQLRNAAGVAVPATVSWTSATRTATLQPSSALAYSAAYTATITGGGAGVRDTAGNALASTYSWAFTTTAEPSPLGCPCRLWSNSTVPDRTENDVNAVEVGVRFRADVDGFITGLRFHKGTTNTGTHVGHLWTAAGTLLATATFTNETASGWQEVGLSSPVAVTANTVYVASYHAPVGRYSVTSSYFASDYANPPLVAPASGGNAVYRYGPSGSFPNQTFLAENYWVDVVFFETLGPDTTPPLVQSVSPPSGGTGASVAASVTATFNEAMNPATITTASVELRSSAGTVLPVAVTYDSAFRAAVIDPADALAYLTTYTVTVQGGASGAAVKDLAGNALASSYSWSFTTGAPPPPSADQGPGGPILVITSATHPFGSYVAEILRTEGLNAFAVADVSQISAAMLGAYDTAVLGEMLLTDAQVALLTNWVTAGGNLIALRPDVKLAGLLGLTAAGAALSNAYLLVDTAVPPGQGLVGETMQFHGVADRYTLSGATSVAMLYSSATTATSNPAVTLRNVGSSGGQAAAFTYDLARSIVYTRQGNPAWSGQERDGVVPIRSNDLFTGPPDWVDMNKVAIPQADEQQRLLANLILHMTADRRPLPRFWYLPRGLKAAVVMTGDDHGNGGTVGRFNTYLSAGPPGCSVVDWECIRGTSYIYPNTPMSDAQALGFTAAGFEVALHLSTNCADWTRTSLETSFATQLAEFASAFPSVAAPVTNRTHCVVWSDYVTQPDVERQNGIRFDTNYYYFPPSWASTRPGVFTGSGWPMRFVQPTGQMIDVYQATTQMTDESNQSYPFTVDALLNRALGPEGYYGVFTANMHTDVTASDGSDAIVAAARVRGVPVVSARQMLEWVDGRNASSFQAIVWSGSTLSFDVVVGAGANGLRAMVPTRASSGALTGITRNLTPIAYTTETIKGVEYAIFSASAGNYRAAYGFDAAAPLISAVSATAAGDGTATVTWTTNEVSDSRVDFGTSPAALSANASNAALVTSHSLTLVGLAPGTTYYYRVVSADAASNSTTWPSLSDAPASFSTPLPAISIADVSLAEGQAGTINAVFTLTLAPASPQTVTVNYATSDASASAGSDYAAQSGQIAFAPGVTTQTLAVAVNGDTLVEPNETFLVSLTGPTNATLSRAQAVGTVTNDDVLPFVTISDVTVTEGNVGTVNAVFTVSLSASSGQTVTLAYATANDTAAAGSDYTAASGTLTFAAGVTSRTVTVAVTGDTVPESNERFFVNLTTPVNATIADPQAAGTITNDDVLPFVTINDVTVTEGNSGTVNAVFTVSLSAQSSQTVTVAYATANDSATAGSDYTAASGTLTFTSGVTSRTVTVAVTGDIGAESNERFFVNLTAPVNATLSDAQAAGTITNDDGVPGLVAAYGFEEGSGTTTVDKSGTGNTGTLSGAAWTTAGHSGKALSFDGSNDWVTVNDAAALDVTRITMMAWVRPTVLSGWRTVMLKESGGGLAWALYAHDNAPQPASYVSVGGIDRQATGTGALPLNAWTHLATTYDGTTLRFYVGGTQVGSLAATGNILTSTGALRIGGNSVWGEYFAGVIDDVRIYNRALSAAEIQADMNAPVGP